MKKVIVIGVIALFICVSVQPAFAVEPKSSVDTNEKEEDCDCETVSDVDFNRLDKTLNRLESYTKLLSLFSKHNPEIAEISKVISNKVSSIREIYQEIKDNNQWGIFEIFICILLYMIYIPLNQIYLIVGEIYDELPWEHPLKYLFEFILIPTMVAFIFVVSFGTGYECWWAPDKLPWE